MKKEILFKIFLLAYAIFLIFHTAKMEWGTLAIILLLSGLLLALFAHAKKGFITVLLLAIHMTIEWSHHIEFGLLYEAREIVLHGIHIIFDLVFLVSEIKRHRKGAFKAIVGGVVIALISLFLLGGDNHTHEEYGDSHETFPLEALVVGGILGCVGVHLFERRKNQTETPPL